MYTFLLRAHDLPQFDSVIQDGVRRALTNEMPDSEEERPTLGDVSLIASALLGASGDTIEIEGCNYLVEITTLYPGPQVGDFFLVPLEPLGQFQPAWRFNDREKTQRRRGLCLRIAYQNRDRETPSVRYLLDFERRMTAQNSMLLLWSPDGLPLADEGTVLTTVVQRIAWRGSPALPIDQLERLSSRTRKHTSNDAATLLAEIYLAKDRIRAAGADLHGGGLS